MRGNNTIKRASDSTSERPQSKESVPTLNSSPRWLRAIAGLAPESDPQPELFQCGCGLQRTFAIGHRMNLKFRVEEFNATNHVHFNPARK